jgi:hypothetical protein
MIVDPRAADRVDSFECDSHMGSVFGMTGKTQKRVVVYEAATCQNDMETYDNAY